MGGRKDIRPVKASLQLSPKEDEDPRRSG